MNAATREKQRERTAHHEAGHAVACVHLNRAFRAVTITLGDDSLGHILYARSMRKFRPDLGSDPNTRRQTDRLILIALMGMASERVHAGRRNWAGGRADIEAARDLASYLYTTSNVVESYLAFMVARSDELADSPLFRVKVEHVAGALLDRERLTSPEVRRLCREAMADRPRIIELNRESLARESGTSTDTMEVMASRG